MKTTTHQPNIHPSFLRRFAGPLLSLAATLAAMSSPPVRADDTVNYGDTLRYYESLSPTTRGKPVQARHPARHLGYVRMEPSAHGRTPSAKSLSTGRRTDEIPQIPRRDARGVVSPAAEATGAAEGQTVNRAINDLNPPPPPDAVPAGRAFANGGRGRNRKSFRRPRFPGINRGQVR